LQNGFTHWNRDSLRYVGSPGLEELVLVTGPSYIGFDRMVYVGSEYKEAKGHTKRDEVDKMSEEGGINTRRVARP